VIVRIHDLLEIEAQRFLEVNLSAPAWVAESLRTTPFVVVRRGLAPPGEIAVGVRGEQRNQRWAGTCDPSWIHRLVTPDTTRRRCAGPASPQPRSDTIPALRSLALLAHHESWKSLSHRWGPGGSVGFELATGRHTASSQSDLDLVIYADERLSVEEAKHLHVSTQSLPSAVDIRVETPFCGFSLAEYAGCAPAPILLRKVSGVVLGVDPWDDGYP
jgi:phosphoribosyl-dephospho-CoA transferase